MNGNFPQFIDEYTNSNSMLASCFLPFPLLQLPLMLLLPLSMPPHLLTALFADSEKRIHLFTLSHSVIPTAMDVALLFVCGNPFMDTFRNVSGQ